MFALELPHRGDSNEYTQYSFHIIFEAIVMSTHDIPFSKKKKKSTLNYPKSATKGFFQGLKNELEIAVVNKPSVFEPLKFYCISRNFEIYQKVLPQCI